MTTKTYSIEKSLYKVFDDLTTEKNINKSSFIEDCVKNFLKEYGLVYVDELYELKSDPQQTIIVIAEDMNYFISDDGSKIEKSLFRLLFKKFEPIDPKKFFKENDDLIAKEIIKNVTISNRNEKTRDTISDFKDIDDQERLGNKYFEEGNVDTALKCWRNALQGLIYQTPFKGSAVSLPNGLRGKEIEDRVQVLKKKIIDNRLYDGKIVSDRKIETIKTINEVEDMINKLHPKLKEAKNYSKEELEDLIDFAGPKDPDVFSKDFIKQFESRNKEE